MNKQLRSSLVAVALLFSSFVPLARAQVGTIPASATVAKGVTCPPVATPSGGAGSQYNCTSGAIYIWDGATWIAAGGGGGSLPLTVPSGDAVVLNENSNRIFDVQVSGYPRLGFLGESFTGFGLDGDLQAYITNPDGYPVFGVNGSGGPAMYAPDGDHAYLYLDNGMTYVASIDAGTHRLGLNPSGIWATDDGVPSTLYVSALRVTFDSPVFTGSGGTTASFTTNLGVPNADLTWSADSDYPAQRGNFITVGYTAGVPNQSLSYTFLGGGLTVYLATDGDGVITTTAQDLIDLSLGDVIPSLAGGDGTGVLTEMGSNPLAGGSASVNVTGPVYLNSPFLISSQDHLQVENHYGNGFDLDWDGGAIRRLSPNDNEGFAIRAKGTGQVSFQGGSISLDAPTSTGHPFSTASVGIAASYTTDLGVPNADLVFTAQGVGATYNDVYVQMFTDGADQPLSVLYNSGLRVIQVTLQTVGSTPVSTADEIASAINADGPSNALIEASFAPGNDGSGVVPDQGETHFILAGGLFALNVTGPSWFGNQAGDSYNNVLLGTVDEDSTFSSGYMRVQRIFVGAPLAPDGALKLSFDTAEISVVGAGPDYSLNFSAKGAGTINLNSAVLSEIGISSDTTGSVNKAAFGSDITAGSHESMYGLSGFIGTAGSSTVDNVYGFESFIGTEGTSAVGNVTGARSNIQVLGTSTVENAYGFYVTIVEDDVDQITSLYGFDFQTNRFDHVPDAYVYHSEDLAGKATNPYYEWFDSRGVRRVKEDAAFDGVGQAIEALYNPQFAKYTAGAANFERVVLGQWNGNVAEIGTQAGGTGTLRPLRLIGSSVETSVPITVPSIIPTTDGFSFNGTISGNDQFYDFYNLSPTASAGSAIEVATVGNAATGEVRFFLTAHTSDTNEAGFNIALDGNSGNATPDTALNFPGAAVFAGASSYAFDDAVTATDFLVGAVSQAHLTGTTGSIGGGLLTAGSCASGTVAVTNSTTAMTVAVSPNTYPGDGTDFYGYVSSNGTVTVKVCAIVGITPTASTYNVRVVQ